MRDIITAAKIGYSYARVFKLLREGVAFRHHKEKGMMEIFSHEGEWLADVERNVVESVVGFVKRHYGVPVGTLKSSSDRNDQKYTGLTFGWSGSQNSPNFWFKHAEVRKTVEAFFAQADKDNIFRL